MKKVILCWFILLLITISACSRSDEPNPRSESQTQKWEPNTGKLDEVVKTEPNMAGFANDVKLFYDNLHGKRWAETYRQRTLSFRNFFPEKLYLKIASESGWSLDDYEILSVERHSSDVQNTDKVILICKFIEGPSPHTSYNTVTWIFENGTWKCDRAGPKSLAIFFSETP